MSQLSWSDLVDGQISVASDFNTPLTAIKNRINNGMESDNIAAGAVGTSALASDSVTTAKLSHPVLFEKSSDVASSGTTDLATATGNVVDITGTTTITAFGTLQSGTVMFLRFTGILTITHHATSLILPTGANITTAAADSCIMESLGSGNWRMHSYQRKAGTALVANQAGNSVQVVNTQTGTSSSGSTAVPYDNTIPQNTEGDEYMTLAITPTSATNVLLIQVVVQGSTSVQNEFKLMLFQDSTANALAVGWGATASPTVPGFGMFIFKMTAGTTSSTTFKVRCGVDSGTFYFNSVGGADKYGGTLSSSITITEIKV